MEAATTLPFSRIRTFNGELLIDGLRIDDETAVEMVFALEQRGETADRLVKRMIEVGARVIERESTGQQADFVRAEFERAARQLDTDFVERARKVADRLDAKVDEVFGPEHGHVTRALERHFGDESSAAVQHKMRAVLAEVQTQMREDLRKQLTSDSADNPIVAIQRATLGAMKLFDWAYRRGAETARELGYTPLPEAAQASVRASWDAVRGPDGKPIWGA